MNSLFLPSSLVLTSPHSKSSLYLQPKLQFISSFRCSHHGHNLSTLYHSPQPSLYFRLNTHHRAIGDSPSNEGTVSVMSFEDFLEKDWSFLDSDELNSQGQIQKIDQIISAGEIDETSRVLVSTSSEGFVDRVVDSSPCSLLLVVHDSLFVLADIKEKYDKVKCWQGELIHVPQKWAPLDVVFLYFLPALPFTLDQVFETLANCCLSGARVVISHPQGKEALQEQKKQFPDVIVSDLPDQMTLQKVAENHSFEIAKFVNEPGFYLVVLKFCKKKNSD